MSTSKSICIFVRVSGLSGMEWWTEMVEWTGIVEDRLDGFIEFPPPYNDHL